MIFFVKKYIMFFSLNKQIMGLFCKESKKKQNVVFLTKNYQSQN